MTPIATSNRGEFRLAALDPPLALAIGDKVEAVGDKLFQFRAGVLIAERTIPTTTTAVDPAVDVAQTVTSLLFFRSFPVAGISLVMTNVQRNDTTGAVTVTYSDEAIVEYASWADLVADAEPIDTNNDAAKKILLNKLIRLEPEGSNLTRIVGAQLSINGNADQPIVYTPPE